jgi:hypothetical protein
LSRISLRTSTPARRERDRLHAAIRRRRPALDELALLQPVDHQVICEASHMHDLGHHAHGTRLVGMDDGQHLR